jgi:glycosyltransferase involved in cell wall biosynthesis
MRVLHIVGVMDRWSVETWLLEMLAHARRRGLELNWTFYCTFGMIQSPVPIGRKGAFVRALRTELKRGQYDILHSHHDLISAVYLTAALGLPIRRRVVHVHNPDECILTPSPIKQAVLRPLLRRTCVALADRIAANSNHSLDTFLAGRPRLVTRDLVHYLGIDSSRFEAAKGDRSALRLQLGWPESTPILLFAGRMTPEKNPVFVIDVLAALRQKMPEARAVFVGQGSLEHAVRVRGKELCQEEAVHYLGWRDDVPEIMAASDWFILPHPEVPMEGFGIAVVEAQLAGLRMLLSHGIADDPLLPTAAYRRLSLKDDAQLWAQAALDLWHEAPPSRAEALAAFKNSPMEINHALDNLLRLYA